MRSFRRWSKHPSQEQRQRKQGQTGFQRGCLKKSIPHSTQGLEVTTVMVRRLLFEGTLDRFTVVSPCSDTGLRQHAMKRQSRSLEVHTGRSSLGTECQAGKGLRGASAQAPPVTEEEVPQWVNLSWVTQGRATTGTGAPLSSPGLLPCRSSHQLPTPVLTSAGAPLPAPLSHHQNLSSFWRLILQLSSPEKGEART